MYEGILKTSDTFKQVGIGNTVLPVTDLLNSSEVDGVFALLLTLATLKNFFFN